VKEIALLFLKIAAVGLELELQTKVLIKDIE
jgi:hypothetical protein